MKEGIGTHSLWTLPLIGNVHSDTILTTWLAMIVALVLLALVGSSYRAPHAGKTQTIFEGVIDYIADMVHGSLGKRGEPFVPFFIALFIFIFLMNQFGVFPFKALGLPFGGSPTGDINTTIPLALIVFFLIQYMTIKLKGAGGYAHLFKPIFLAPINILEEIVRPVTLAARLFFNIFVGELLFIIIASIVNAKVSVGPVNLSMAVSVLPFFIQFFNFFVGTVQAFVFTLLGIVYLSLAIGEEH
ncbi:MAG: F0F1 ATP synthase subunit A [Vulcanimicrobiaceae bacterium]